MLKNNPLYPAILRQHINHYAQQQTPFFFMINFDQSEGYFLSHTALQNNELLFSFPLYSNSTQQLHASFSTAKLNIKKTIDYEMYKGQFAKIQQELIEGHTFLVNLTQSTLIETDLNLLEIFYLSDAKYKIYLKNHFICFSPETFVKIDATGKISTYPMKGTINTDLPNAKQLLNQNPKEIAEHQTIVDLMRNDLNTVAQHVKVEAFRYFETIQTQQRDLYQTSSHISGQLPTDYLAHLGDIIFKLLPAGSISGAPKPSTLNIIRQVESHQRGYYTGIAGYFDGNTLDSCVLIRFIEQQHQQLFYKSGGGITADSELNQEYAELIEKIYLPLQSLPKNNH